MIKSSLARAFQSGNRQGVQLVIDVPTRFQDIAVRHHNRFVKDALGIAMVNHYRNVIPGHFKQDAHAKYGYATRDPKYIRSKIRRYGTGTDLVKTGKSRAYMTHNYTLTIGGAAEGGKRPISATLSMRFPFAGGTGAQREQSSQQRRMIDIRQMIHEMQAMTDAERTKIASDFWTEYCNKVRQFRGRRQRRRMPNNTNFARPAAWGEL